jgi:hypothetical protein
MLVEKSVFHGLFKGKSFSVADVTSVVCSPRGAVVNLSDVQSYKRTLTKTRMFGRGGATIQVGGTNHPQLLKLGDRGYKKSLI